jgi:exodeoxyribonuclease-3
VPVKLLSWNVNGIRAASRHGFWDWLPTASPDILCLQETRIQPEQLTGQMRNPPGYQAVWHHAERKGYSGVATFFSSEAVAVQAGFGRPEFDLEGRVLATEHDGFTLVNAYFPSGQRGHERVTYKLTFYDALLDFCTDLRRRGRRLIVCGDFNTAHQPIDLARPKQNVKTSGFLPVEREALTRWLDWGFVDVYRHLYPDSAEYTWWTYRLDARKRNIGWRIDYFLVTNELLPLVQDARILTEVMGSDHCPIELRLDI